MRERDWRPDPETDGATSSSSPSSSSASSSSSPSSSASEDTSARKHGSSKRKRSISTGRVKDDTESSYSSGSSDADVKRRKSKSMRGKEKRSMKGRRSSKSDREKERKRERKRRSSRGGSDEKPGRKEKHRRKDRHDRERRKRKVTDAVDPVSTTYKDEDVPVVQFGSKSTLQAVNEAQLQQKEIVRRNVEIAKARLASGELQRMKHEQMEMQRLYGTVDWREKKKLRAEKSRLERTVAAGKKLASIEERESARMDAFRVALGLPTAEAQRQAEWRAEATRALAEAEALNKDNISPPVSSRVPSRSRKVLGPRLPH